MGVQLLTQAVRHLPHRIARQPAHRTPQFAQGRPLLGVTSGEEQSRRAADASLPRPARPARACAHSSTLVEENHLHQPAGAQLVPQRQAAASVQMHCYRRALLHQTQAKSAAGRHLADCRWAGRHWCYFGRPADAKSMGPLQGCMHGAEIVIGRFDNHERLYPVDTANVQWTAADTISMHNC